MRSLCLRSKNSILQLLALAYQEWMLHTESKMPFRSILSPSLKLVLRSVALGIFSGTQVSERIQMRIRMGFRGIHITKKNSMCSWCLIQAAYSECREAEWYLFACSDWSSTCRRWMDFKKFELELRDCCNEAQARIYLNIQISSPTIPHMHFLSDQVPVQTEASSNCFKMGKPARRQQQSRRSRKMGCFLKVENPLKRTNYGYYLILATGYRKLRFHCTVSMSYFKKPFYYFEGRLLRTWIYTRPG